MLNEVGAGCSEVQEEIDPALQGFTVYWRRQTYLHE